MKQLTPTQRLAAIQKLLEGHLKNDSFFLNGGSAVIPSRECKKMLRLSRPPVRKKRKAKARGGYSSVTFCFAPCCGE